MLPKIITITKNIITPITGVKLKICPYTVGDEKALLSIVDEDINEQSKKVYELCQNKCEGDLDKILFAELYWVYLQLYSISVNEMLEVSQKHTDNCETVNIKIPIKDITIDIPPQNSMFIEIDTEAGKKKIELHYPLINDVLNTDISNTENNIASYIGCMFDEDGNNREELSFEDKTQLFDMLDIKNGKLVMDFIRLTPITKYNIDYECPTCKERVSFVINHFFG